MIRQGKHARRSLIDLARKHRRKQTRAEAMMWSALRRRRLPARFRRQHQVGDYIVDFYCAELKLAIELDGDSHFGVEEQKRDMARTEALQAMGVTVIHFENSYLLYEDELALEHIVRIIETLRVASAAGRS